MRRIACLSATLALIAVLGACGGDDGVSADPSVAFLVGDWSATHMVVTPDLAPDQALDLVEAGGSFSINVQPSGQYTAVIGIPGFGAPPPELGTLTVEGDEIVFTRTSPPPRTVSRATYEEIAPGHVTFSGPSEVDLDGNGTMDAVTLEVEIVRD